jgi:hypothetical protein
LAFPDGQFTYADRRYPFFVLEVGYSHKSKGTTAKNLPGLAKYYYKDMDIKTVLTVDIEYTPKARRKGKLGLGRHGTPSKQRFPSIGRRNV